MFLSDDAIVPFSAWALSQYFKIEGFEHDEIWLRPLYQVYTAEEVIEIVKIMAEILPDEYECDRGKKAIRLWWD